MECHPIDSSVVAFEDKFHDGIGVAEHVRLVLVLANRFLKGH